MKKILTLCSLLLFVYACKKESAAPSTTPTSIATTVEWKQTNQAVATGADIKLSFNNTAFSLSDDRQNLHLVYQDAAVIKYGMRNNSSGVWSFQSLPKLAINAPVSKPTIGTTGNGVIYISWTESATLNNQAVLIIRSTDYGVSWTTPFIVTNGNYETPLSMYVFTRSNNNPGIVLAWYDVVNAKCYSTTWRGNFWNTTDWTVPAPLSSGSAISHDASLNGYGEIVYAAWEDDRSGQKEIFIKKSTDGGLTWGQDMVVTSTGSVAIRGQDPSLSLSTTGTIHLAYQNQNRVYYTSKTNSATDFNSAVSLGDGLFAHLSINAQGMVAISWEHFLGNIFDDSGKTVGLSLSLNNMQSYDAPHVLPGSATMFFSVQSTVSMSAQWLDIFWIDGSDAANRKLKYAYAEIK